MAPLLPQARRLAAQVNARDVCASCLHNFGVQLKDADSRAVDGVRRGCPEFWNACAGVLANSSLGAMGLGALHGCTLHASGGAGEDPVHVLCEAACACLHFCLFTGERSVFQRAARDHTPFGRRGVWPTKMEDVVPDGGTALVGWCVRASPAPYAMVLLADLLFVAHAQIFPLVLQGKDAMVDVLARRMGAEPPVLPDLSPAAIAYRLNFGAALAVVRGVIDAPNADPDALLQLTLGHESRLFASANHALETPTHLLSPDVESALAKFAASLFPRLELPYAGLDPRIQAHVEDPSKLGFAGILHALFQRLSTRRRVCAARNCDTQPGGRRFFRCKSCDITPYCSRECQLHDWTGGHIPHKDVCPLIRGILAVAPVGTSRQEFERVVLSAYQWSFKESYYLAYFAIAHGSLPMYLLPRAWYFHIQFSAAVGLPVDEYEELARNPEMATAMDVLNRQKIWSAGV